MRHPGIVGPGIAVSGAGGIAIGDGGGGGGAWQCMESADKDNEEYYGNCTILYYSI